MFQRYTFNDLSISDIYPEHSEKHQLDKIKQIDCIWTDRLGMPRLENKIGLIYREELIKFYDDHIEEIFDEADFGKVFANMEI